MKKNAMLSMLCAGAMLLASAAMPMQVAEQVLSVTAAEEEEIKTYQGFNYIEEPRWNSVKIVGYEGDLKNLTIPNTINGKRVDEITVNAFSGNENIESLTLPSNLINIPAGAFYGCTSLKSFNCSANKHFSFSGGILYFKVLSEQGYSITSSDYTSTITYHKVALFCAKDNAYITVNDGTDYIADYAFACREKMTHVILPAGIQYIGNHAFYKCTKLRGMSMLSEESGNSEFNIPYGTVTIENKAFFGCEEIRTVSFPSTLEYIGDHAFSNCPKLKSAYIPDNVQRIGNAAFGYETEEWEDGHMTSSGNVSFTMLYDNEETEDGDTNAGLEYAQSNYMQHTTTGGYQGGGMSDDGVYQITDANGNVITINMNVTHDPNNDFDHNYVITACVPVTCTTPGAISGICYCGHTYYREFPALGHDFSEEVTVDPTCTEDGYTGMKCSRCDVVFEKNMLINPAVQIPEKQIIPALGHSYGTPTYAWSEDHTSCIGTAVCERDSNHVKTAAGTVTSKKDGDTTIYTAVFADPFFSTQTVKVKNGTPATEPTDKPDPATEPKPDPAPATGDVDGSGDFGVTDVIQIQKWMLAVPGATLQDWRAADFNKDGVLDVFDLGLMKRALLNTKK